MSQADKPKTSPDGETVGRMRQCAACSTASSGVHCVVFALRREAEFFLADLPAGDTLRGAPCPVRRYDARAGGPLVLQTGVGAAAVDRALAWLRAQDIGRIETVVSAGFSGALQQDLQVGDLVLATEVVDASGNMWPATGRSVSPTGASVPVPRAGRLLCVADLVGEPAEKARLGKRHQALAADMETATLAAFCHQQKLPFTSLRVICDRVDTRLSPDLTKILRGPRAAPVQLAFAVARRPRLLYELCGLARATRAAAKALADGLHSLMITNRVQVRQG